MLQFLSGISGLFSYFTQPSETDENETHTAKKRKIVDNPLDSEASSSDESYSDENYDDYYDDEPEDEFELNTDIDLSDIIITKSDIKAKIDKYIINQRKICFGIHPTIQAVPSQIGENDCLDAEHVDGLLHYLVSNRNHLKNSVAIFPVYNADAIAFQAQTFVYKKLKVDLRCQHLVPSNVVLPERSTLEPDALEERDKEERKRNAQETALRQKADEVLANNNITEEKLFQWFLEAMTESTYNLLGNRFRNCTQCIIPIRIDNGHYTTAVTHMTGRTTNKNANITYYDSKGHELYDTYQASLCAFFTDKGYDINYEDISENDQKYDGVNCGLFASLKSIDIANNNVGHNETLLDLDELTEEEYKQYFRTQRYQAVQILSSNGFNISADESIHPDTPKPKTRKKRTYSGNLKKSKSSR